MQTNFLILCLVVFTQSCSHGRRVKLQISHNCLHLHTYQLPKKQMTYGLRHTTVWNYYLLLVSHWSTSKNSHFGLCCFLQLLKWASFWTQQFSNKVELKKEKKKSKTIKEGFHVYSAISLYKVFIIEQKEKSTSLKITLIN